MAVLVQKKAMFHEPVIFASYRVIVFWCLMVGFGETYVSAFAIYLGASPFQLGLIGLIPLSIAAPSQWLGYRFSNRLQQRRVLIYGAALAQVFMWLGLCLLALGVFIYDPILSLMCLIVGHYFFGAFALPPWNSLIGDIVPDESRGYYFGYVNKWSGLALLFAMMLGGCILQLGEYARIVSLSFLTIFFLAAASRYCSSRWLQRLSDPWFPAETESFARPFSFVQDLFRTPFGRYVFFTSGYRAIAQLEGPFYAWFMLEYLEFSYLTLMIITTTGFSAQYLLSQVWGDLSDDIGNKKVLLLCSYGLIGMPACWLLSSNVSYLLVVQLITGYFWAGFNLSSLSFLYDLTAREKRAQATASISYVTCFLSICFGLGGSFLMGAMLEGNFFMQKFEEERMAYVAMFLGASFLRMCFVLLTRKSLTEVRAVNHVSRKEILVRLSYTRPVIRSVGSFWERSSRQQKKEFKGDKEKRLKPLDKPRGPNL